jgi:hypothetical protein
MESAIEKDLYLVHHFLYKMKKMIQVWNQGKVESIETLALFVFTLWWGRTTEYWMMDSALLNHEPLTLG